MKMQKKLTGLTFRQGYLIFVAVLAALFLVVLGVLWLLLAQYQRGQDALAVAKAEMRAPQLAFEQFVREASAEDWADEWLRDHPESYDDPALVAEEMARQFSADRISLHKAADCSTDAPAFTVFSGDTLLATVTMTGSGLDWAVGDVAMELPGSFCGSITVTRGDTALCNGRPIGEELGESAPSPYIMDYCTDLLSGSAAEWVCYTVTGQMFEPVFSAAGADGRAVAEVDGCWSAVLDDQTAAPFREESERFARQLLTYFIQGSSNTGANMYKTGKFTRIPSQAYDTIANAREGISWGTPFYIAESEYHAGPAVILADNIFAIDVAFHAVGRYGSIDNIVDGTYRVYYIDNGEGYRIMNLFLS